MFSTPAETLLFPCENMITWKKDDQREENGKAKVSSYPASVSNEKHRKFYASCVNPPPCIPNLLSINPIAFSRKKLKTHFFSFAPFLFLIVNNSVSFLHSFVKNCEMCKILTKCIPLPKILVFQLRLQQFQQIVRFWVVTENALLYQLLEKCTHLSPPGKDLQKW